MEFVTLEPFPGLHIEHARNYKIEAGAEAGPAGLTLAWKIRGSNPAAMADIVLPEAKERGTRVEGLWKQTCFEAFLPHLDSDAYLEFNGSPSGDWNCYSFRNYREGMNPVPVNGASPPRVLSYTHGSKELELRFLLPMAVVKQGFFSLGIGSIELGPIGLTLVLNGRTATTYWALTHDGVKPDFHLRSSFTYDSIRN
jgi:hypothetical protein